MNINNIYCFIIGIILFILSNSNETFSIGIPWYEYNDDGNIIDLGSSYSIDGGNLVDVPIKYDMNSSYTLVYGEDILEPAVIKEKALKIKESYNITKIELTEYYEFSNGMIDHINPNRVVYSVKLKNPTDIPVSVSNIRTDVDTLGLYFNERSFKSGNSTPTWAWNTSNDKQVFFLFINDILHGRIYINDYELNELTIYPIGLKLGNSLFRTLSQNTDIEINEFMAHDNIPYIRLLYLSVTPSHIDSEGFIEPYGVPRYTIFKLDTDTFEDIYTDEMIEYVTKYLNVNNIDLKIDLKIVIENPLHIFIMGMNYRGLIRLFRIDDYFEGDKLQDLEVLIDERITYFKNISAPAASA